MIAQKMCEFNTKNELNLRKKETIMTTKQKVRLNAELAPDVANALRLLAQDQGVSVSEAVRRAISTETYIYRAQQSGKKVLIDQDGRLKEVVFR